MKWLVLLHVLGATVWVGGHLILTLGFLPAALKSQNPVIVQRFEEHYERVGIPALLLQLVTGVWMATLYVPFASWFSLATPHHTLLWLKFFLLACTLGLAVHARFFIIPKLKPQNLSLLALHIISVTLIGMAFVVVGLSFRFSYF
jgi:putative copper export protein